MGATRPAERLTLRPCARCVKHCRRRVHVDRLERILELMYGGRGFAPREAPAPSAVAAEFLGSG